MSLIATAPAASARAATSAEKVSAETGISPPASPSIAGTSAAASRSADTSGSLRRDGEGNFSLVPVRGLEACHRAGAEVVLMSGRREAQVMEDARLIGQSSYIYEAGCAFVIDGETTVLTGDLVPDQDGTVYEKIEARGIPELLFDRFDGRLEYHAPWHSGRVLSHLFRGKVDV